MVAHNLGAPIKDLYKLVSVTKSKIICKLLKLRERKKHFISDLFMLLSHIQPINEYLRIVCMKVVKSRQNNCAFKSQELDLTRP